jgi:hypothetical protein
MVWNSAMLGFPSFKIYGSYPIVPIASALLSDIDSDAGSDHMFDWNLVERLFPSQNMDRRINVRTAMLRHLHTI